MKRLLLIGRGQIGTALGELLTGFELIPWLEDIDDLSSEAMVSLHPDIILNAAGKTDLAWCEANAREAFRSNVEAPVQLYARILEANERSSAMRRAVNTHAETSNAPNGYRPPIRFIHFSSGCVWDGPYDQNGEAFVPSSPISPACLYSWTKAAADSLLLDLDPNNVAILRPRQVFSGSTSPRNTLMKLLRYPALIDTPNSMTSVAVIAKTVSYVSHANHNWSGIWNLYDRGITTPFEVGILLWKRRLREKPELLQKADLDAFHVPKRVDTVLHDDRFELTIEVNSVHDELERAIEELHERLSL